MKNKNKRYIEVVVISDVHLGTYGCNAKELLTYLKSINPDTIILNGDIIDIWQFSKRFWPKSHMKVIKYLIGWIAEGKKMYYITGNHDELFRKFADFELASFFIKNKVLLELDGKKAWFFHGDVFDVTMKHSKWLAKLGAVGYDFLILLNKGVNLLNHYLGLERVSFSKKIKNSVKSAVKFINNFEDTVATIAIDNKYDYVVCGHIHQPVIKKIQTDKGNVTYLNSGDWIENLTALEYVNMQWTLYKYDEKIEKEKEEIIDADELVLIDKSAKELFGQLVADFNVGKL